MEYGILGQREIRDVGRLRPIPGINESPLLGLLPIEAGAVVSLDRMIFDLCGGDPPASAVRVLRSRAVAFGSDAGGPRRRRHVATLDICSEPNQARVIGFDPLRSNGGDDSTVAGGELAAVGARASGPGTSEAPLECLVERLLKGQVGGGGDLFTARGIDGLGYGLLDRL